MPPKKKAPSRKLAAGKAPSTRSRPVRAAPVSDLDLPVEVTTVHTATYRQTFANRAAADDSTLTTTCLPQLTTTLSGPHTTEPNPTITEHGVFVGAQLTVEVKVKHPGGPVESRELRG